MAAKLKVQVYDLNGHKVGRIVDGKTLDSAATLKEAIDGGFVVGEEHAVKDAVEGVLKCMIAGIGKDGNGRKIDGYLSLNAFPKGRLEEITDEYEAKKVVVRAQLLKEFKDKVDASKFTIILEGSEGTFVIETVTTGEAAGEIVLTPTDQKDVAMNGRNTSMGEGDSIKYSIPELGESGTFSATEITSDSTRITIAGSAFASLATATHDGKTIVFTVEINGKKVLKSATLHYVA